MLPVDEDNASRKELENETRPSGHGFLLSFFPAFLLNHSLCLQSDLE
jgi:hypothetical protein